MQVKRFVAADMRRALELVRLEMGPDAVILSSQRHKDGVEIMTTLEELPQVPASLKGMVPTEDHSTGFESPLASDSAWGDQASVNSALKDHEHLSSQDTSPPLPQEQSRGVASGKTSQQLADEIERARERMLAARKAEGSVPVHPTMRQQSTVNYSSDDRAALDQMAANQNRASQAGVSDGPFAPRGEAVSQQWPDANQHPRTRNAEAVSSSTRSVDADDQREQASVSARSQASSLEQAVKQSTADIEQDQKLSALQSELAGMRHLLEEQLGRMSWGQMASQSPVQANLWRRFNRLGLPASCTEALMSQLTQQESMAEAWPEALATLSHQLPVQGRDVVDEGGVFAFVGPTGVGKTTTIGKLAARYALKYGSDRVALVTTDTYRIAAQDQLRSVGRILNVAVRVVDDNHSLGAVLDSLQDYPLVLIDTAGFRHGDPLLKEQLVALKQHQQVKNYLVLATNSQLQMMKASIHAYHFAGLSGCILTKLDETASLGEAIGVVVDQQLPVAYTTDGQEIPQDIDVARAHQLVSSAVALMKQNTVDEQRLVSDFSSARASSFKASGARTGLGAVAEHLY